MSNIVLEADTPLLSVCIPAYQYEEGVRRILNRFESDPRLEILISEDKSDKPLHLDDLQERVHFKHTVNHRPQGAIANWNGLLQRAKGTYIWLLHHDEEPYFENGLKGFLDSLEAGEQRDCLVSHLKLRDRWWQRALRSDGLRKILVRFPKSVLFQNYIGSPSNIIIHHSTKELFDEDLKWFIDIEWYFRLFSNSKKITFSEFAIVTHPYAGSITKSLGNTIRDLSTFEANTISDRNSLGPIVKQLWLSKLTFVHKIKKWVGK